MALATSTESGAPAVRMVLLRRFSSTDGYLVFYTNYRSRKGRELAANSRAAAAMYWEEFGGRQLRFEGPVVKSPDRESDTYFATRPLSSQLNAWVSRQSAPIDSLDRLHDRARALAAEHALDAGTPESGSDGTPLERPEFWGGYRLWIDRLELWTEGQGRFHDRLSFSRSLEADANRGFIGGLWIRQRLQP